MSTVGITVLLAGLSMIGPLGIDAYLPSFHAIGAEFDAGPLVVQQTLSVYAVCFAVMLLVYGTLSDSFGRRPVILAGVALFALGSVAAVFATSIGGLIAARALQGLAAGAGAVVGRAVVQDRFSGAAAHRVMAHMSMVFGLAPALAPIIGGLLQIWSGWRAVFVFLAVSAALMVLAVLRWLDESLPPSRRQPFHLKTIAANYLRVLRHTRFMLMALSLGFAFTGISLYVGSAAHFVMNILHLPETAFAWLFVPIVGGMMIGSALAPKLLARTSGPKAIHFGFFCMITAALLNVAYTSFAVVPGLPWAVLPLTLYTFGLAFASPGMVVQMLSFFPDVRGMAASVQSFIQMISFAFIAGLIAPLLFGSAAYIAWGLLGGVIVSTLLLTGANQIGSAPEKT